MKTKWLLSLLVVASTNVLASPQQDSGFVAHEWGTFTSVQGSEAIQLEWTPLVSSELPRFVYGSGGSPGDASRGGVTKAAFVTLQRMETPVIYFYSDQPRKVDVSVRFPRASDRVVPADCDAYEIQRDFQLAQQHGMRWANVEILAGAQEPTICLQSINPAATTMRREILELTCCASRILRPARRSMTSSCFIAEWGVSGRLCRLGLAEAKT